MADMPTSSPRLAPASVEVERLPSGGMLLRSPVPLGSYPERLGAHLRRWAGEAPDRIFLAEREATGGWRRVSYRHALVQVEAVGEALLDRGATPSLPVMILSENGLDNAILQLACMYVGVPVAPISPAYSLVSDDHAKLKLLFEVLRPCVVYASSGERFARALSSLKLGSAEVVVSSEPTSRQSTLFSSLTATSPGPAVEKAFSSVGPDTPAKILFTSGSTGTPKGVVNTHRMLCSNQQAMAQLWPFLEEKPPVLLDWLPWSHTFGGNHNFNLVLRNGGTLYIDAGKPLPGHIEKSVANLRDVSPTIYFNVPKGYDALLGYLEEDRELRQRFFRDLDLLFYSGAVLPQKTWEGLERLSKATRGKAVMIATGLGATETAPGITMVHFPVSRPGIIGLPMPGAEVKLVPNDRKLEMRVRGPNVTPGYFKRDDLTAEAFDEEGFYRMGDALKFVDPAEPVQGLLFDGRVSEEFKLTTGTWVPTGAVRLAAIEAASPCLQDAVVTGHDREYVGLLAWPHVDECRKLLGPCADDPEALCRAPELRDRLRDCLRKNNGDQKGSSLSVRRLLLLSEPPSLDASEITDKGYINQRAVLERRAALVERLYAEPPSEDVIVL